jgi:hypothetical protein
MHQAATRPAIAPLAPREVITSLPPRTCADREVKEAVTPAEK